MHGPMTSPSASASGVRAGPILGFAGLIPFFVGAAALWAGPGRIGAAVFSVPSLMLVYAATVASFLGGVRWGVEIVRPEGPSARNLLLSVTPQLAGWALAAAPGLPFAMRFDGLAALLIVQGLADMTAKDLPSWYRALRGPLTVGAAASMAALGAWAHMMAKAHGG